jgi:hypothetical protein
MWRPRCGVTAVLSAAEPDAAEPSLGALHNTDQTQWGLSATDDTERENGDEEDGGGNDGAYREYKFDPCGFLKTCQAFVDQAVDR